MSRKRILILGSTGSIGRQTLEVAALHPSRLEVVGLAAHGNAALLAQQARDFGVSHCGLVSKSAATRLVTELPDCRVFTGAAGLREMVAACAPDLVVGAISGGAGLMPVAEALKAGVDVALANKEPLVMAGGLITTLADRSGARLIPIDSEISAIFQCLQGYPREALARVLLTASGGPFARLSRTELAAVTPAQALKHPNWDMGRKVTIDSATLANKGFELFEVRWLFGVGFGDIEVVVHHQSIVHSLVEFHDTSVLAQLGWPDMRAPIQYALLYPDRVANGLPRLELPTASPLTFAAPDTALFPCLALARQAGEAGGGYPAVLNGADEAAVHLFLAGRIGFLDIPRRIEAALEAFDGRNVGGLDDAVAISDWAYQAVEGA